MLNISQKQKSEKLGFLLFISSLLFYFLFKLPFNLSVLCSNTNEGFYFIFGQHFLNGTHFNEPGRPYLNLFFLIYALIVRLFGFGTKSIIAVHFIQTLVVLLIGIILFFLSKKLFENSFLSGFVVFVWIVLQAMPVGHWGQVLEFNSAFALEAEYFCVLFSLLSIFTLFFAINNDSKRFLWILAGLFASCSIMVKGNGAVIGVSYVCWLIYLLLKERKFLQDQWLSFIFLFIGFLLGLFFFNLFLSLYKTDLTYFWKFYFSVGSYPSNFLNSPLEFLASLLNFMTRWTFSLNNFLVFLIGLSGFIWGIFRNFFIKEQNIFLRLILPIFNIWSFGNVCAVIAPGGYGSYYYILVWPSIAFFLVFVLRDIFHFVKFTQNKTVRIFVFSFILLLFIHRIYLVFPTYLKIAAQHINANFLYQPESFLETLTVSNYGQNSKRPTILEVADLINSYLPHKNDTFYAVNIRKENQFLPVTFYIYTKRLPPTTVVSDYFYYKSFLDERIKVLTGDLIASPPKVIIVPRKYYLQKWQIKKLKSFLDWLDLYLSKNYQAKFSLTYRLDNTQEIEYLDVFLRK